MKLPRKPSNSDFIALDIATSSIKALYIVKDGEKLTAKGVAIKSVFDNEGMQKELLQNVLSECTMQAARETNNVIVGLSGPRVIGFILIAQTNRDNPEVEISEHELDELYEKVKESAYRQVIKRWSVLFANDVEFAPLDLVLTSTTIDGNHVEDPLGSTGSQIQVSVFCSYAEKNYYDKIMKMIKSLKYQVQVVTTALYSESKLLNHSDSNYIIVDIGKEYTDVGVVLGENIVQTRSFGIGGLFFSKELSSKMGFDIQTANGKKEAYSLQTLAEEEADRIGDHLYYSGKMWRSAFETVLTSMTGIKSFPEKIYITGGGAHLPVIQELLYEEEWRQAVPFASEISIEIPKSDSWRKYLHDELNVLAGPQMFVPVSIGIVQLELS